MPRNLPTVRSNLETRLARIVEKAGPPAALNRQATQLDAFKRLARGERWGLTELNKIGRARLLKLWQLGAALDGLERKQGTSDQRDPKSWKNQVKNIGLSTGTAKRLRAFGLVTEHEIHRYCDEYDAAGREISGFLPSLPLTLPAESEPKPGRRRVTIRATVNEAGYVAVQKAIVATIGGSIRIRLSVSAPKRPERDASQPSLFDL